MLETAIGPKDQRVL